MFPELTVPLAVFMDAAVRHPMKVLGCGTWESGCEFYLIADTEHAALVTAGEHDYTCSCGGKLSEPCIHVGTMVARYFGYSPILKGNLP